MGKNLTRDKADHNIAVKDIIHEEYIIILMVYVPENITIKVRLIVLQGEMFSFTVIVQYYVHTLCVREKE